MDFVIGFLMPIIQTVVYLLTILTVVKSLSTDNRTKRATQHLGLQEQIHKNSHITTILYLLETKQLHKSFFDLKLQTTENEDLYKKVVETIKFFDSIAYSFYVKDIGKEVIYYFYGEYNDILTNSAITAYLDMLEEENFQLLCKDYNGEKISDWVELVYPYKYMRISFGCYFESKQYKNQYSKINLALKEKYASRLFDMTGHAETEVIAM